jgi:uncharacterized oxidoreductase
MSRIGTALFQAVDAPLEEAALVAHELVTASLMGHDSHGVLRIPEYLDLVASGTILPGAAMALETRSETTAVADCGHNFGVVGAHFAIDAGVRIAAVNKVSCVVTRHCNHVGRLGAYVQVAAERGMIALATCNSPIDGHFVLPWGGTKGRLATNPIAYGIPAGGDPIVADLSTSVAPEGKIRVHKNLGLPLPEGWVVDSKGKPTTNPDDFYGPPMGAILPLGGAAGHKGFALGLLVELLGGPLAGRSSIDPAITGNGLCFIVIDPSAFGPLDAFKALVDSTVAYVRSGAEPDASASAVLLPGELEFRTRRRRLEEGISVDDVTWGAIEHHARRLGIDLKALSQG